MSKKLFDQTRSDEFKRSVASDENRKAFAAEMAMPIQQEIAPVASVRHIFNERPLAPAAQAVYPLDMGSVDAWVLPGISSRPQNIVEGEELYVPTFELGTSVEYKESYARNGQYDVADTAMKKMLNAIVTKEEALGWAVIRSAATAARTVTVGGATTLTKELLNKMFVKMSETNGMQVRSIFVNNNRFGDLRMWTNTDLDEVTRREVWQRAGMAQMWGATIYELPSLADNEVYAFDTDFFGSMPIRLIDGQLLVTRDNPIAVLKNRVGVLAYEELGFVALDSRGVVKGTI